MRIACEKVAAIFYVSEMTRFGVAPALLVSMIMRAAVLTIAMISQTAHADGVYYSQTLGIGQSSTFGRPLQTRAALGARVRFLSIESFISSDTQLSRDGATMFGFLGGEPHMRSDLDSYGIALRGMLPLRVTPKATLEGYARVGAGLASANGVLEGYDGHTFNGAVGFQLRGKVRALGFAWGPLFLLDRGPRVTGALFVEQSLDLVTLHHGADQMRTALSHTTLGFAVGSSF